MQTLGKNFLSIIIPVYNVEKYLTRCFDSVKTLAGITYEVIVVDDGSTDGSPEICDHYANNYAHFHVHHKANGGLSDARNFGLKYASGEYVYFLDSDDFIDPNTFLLICERAKRDNLDIVYGDAMAYFTAENMYPYSKFAVSSEMIFTGEDFMGVSIMNKAFHQPVWLGLFRKSIILDNNIFYQKGIYHEDLLWTPQVLQVAERVAYEPVAFYMYFQRKDSITMNIANVEKRAKDSLFICRILETATGSGTMKLLNKKLFLDFVAGIYMYTVYFAKKNQVKVDNVDKYLPIRNAFSLRRRVWAILFALSPGLYCRISAIWRHICSRRGK